MRKKLLATSVTGGALALTLAVCAPLAAQQAIAADGDDAAPAETTEVQPSVKLPSVISVTNENLPSIYDQLAQQAQDFASEIRTLEDGTQIQRTPDSTTNEVYYWSADSAYNTLLSCLTSTESPLPR